jgi:hypothetical protein
MLEKKKIHNTTPGLNQALGGGAEMPLLPCPFSKPKCSTTPKEKRKEKRTKRVSPEVSF